MKREERIWSMQEKTVWVVGHKNPDTDSICAAIAYAYLKNATEEGTVLYQREPEISIMKHVMCCNALT